MIWKENRLQPSQDLQPPVVSLKRFLFEKFLPAYYLRVPTLLLKLSHFMGPHFLEHDYVYGVSLFLFLIRIR